MNIYDDEPSDERPEAVHAVAAGRTCHECGRVITEATEPAAIALSANQAVCDDPRCHDAAFREAQHEVARGFKTMSDVIAGLSLDPWTGVIDVSVGAVLRSVGV